jgi:hypothetical protein
MSDEHKQDDKGTADRPRHTELSEGRKAVLNLPEPTQSVDILDFESGLPGHPAAAQPDNAAPDHTEPQQSPAPQETSDE